MESTEKIKNINFSFYSGDEIKRLASVEVKSQIAFDTFRNPWPEGLYDTRMGVSPYDRMGKCVTCGKEQQDCPGHLGYIQLVFPVYNLFLLKDVLRLMRAKCFFCHKFLATNSKVKEFRLMMTLINLGLTAEFLECKELSKINVHQKMAALTAKSQVVPRMFKKRVKTEENWGDDEENLKKNKNRKVDEDSDDEDLFGGQNDDSDSQERGKQDSDESDSEKLGKNKKAKKGGENLDNQERDKQDSDESHSEKLGKNKKAKKGGENLDNQERDKQDSDESHSEKLGKNKKAKKRGENSDGQERDKQDSDESHSEKLGKNKKAKKRGENSDSEEITENKKDNESHSEKLGKNKKGKKKVENSDSEEITEKKKGKKLKEEGAGEKKKGKSGLTEAENLLFEKVYKEILTGLKEKKQEMEATIANSKANFNTHQTSFTHFLKTVTFKEFFKECQSIAKCSHCLRLKPTIKLENNNKFYAYFKGKSEVAEDQKIQLINPIEIKSHLERLFELNGSALAAFYGKFKTNQKIKESVGKGYKVRKFSPEYFFVEVLPVTPNRFRPESQLNGQSFLHAHTLMYTKILGLNEELKELISQKNGNAPTEKKDSKKRPKKEKKTTNENGLEEESPETAKNEIITNMFKKWIEMQEAVNFLFNSDLNMKSGDKESGIKQLLEKKEGIFRMKIMGKRVNFSGRSVISPDPNLHTSEVGIPLFMATKLTYPESVNAYNLDFLKQVIINGPFVYPGALAVEENGVKKLLDGSTLEQRLAIANRLLENCENKTVLRHLISGDYVLFNRQPTLHKPSIMSFRAKVLPKELTIRVNYVNCAGFNADFDGDEMNVHLLQNYLARAEAKHISLADQQYILPTSKAPVRGLIQDFIFAILFITSKDMVLNLSQYMHLFYESLSNQLGEGVNMKSLKILAPAMVWPVKLWTGKQLMTNIIKFVADIGPNAKGLYMKSNTRVNASYFCRVGPEEAQVVVRNNELLTGVFDKNQIGASSFGFVHSFFELYGHEKTGLIFSAITRLCTAFLKIHGFSCGIGDLINTQAFEAKRKTELNNVLKAGIEAQFEHFKIEKSDISGHNFLANLKKQSEEKNENLGNKKTKNENLGNKKKLSEVPGNGGEEGNYFHLPGDKVSGNKKKLSEVPGIGGEEGNYFHLPGDKVSGNKKKLSEVPGIGGEEGNYFHLPGDKVSGNKKKLSEVPDNGGSEEINYFHLPGDIFSPSSELTRSLEKKINEEESGADEMDRVVKGSMSQIQSKLFGENSSSGLLKKFPFNNFSAMILSGAKGSVLNQNLITCNLGQQELEGRRAPLMSSGKSLPCWLPYDPNPRCNGFVTDRFLTGLRPQEFFFHCMAGREGLIDTAVKTSRSGYLQRILVKNLESFAIEYDLTVRDLADKLLIQFYYGEDGLNSMKVNVLENIGFLFDNFEGFKSALSSPTYASEHGMKNDQVMDYLRNRTNGVKKGESEKPGLKSKVEIGSEKVRMAERGVANASGVQQRYETILEKFNPAKNLGAISETGVQQSYETILEKFNPAKNLGAISETGVQQSYETILEKFNPAKNLGAISEKAVTELNNFIEKNSEQFKKRKINTDEFKKLFHIKYFESLMAPGDCVGAVAAQSFGEPSTQMTLNTFHLAGHGGVNVTLGIPRLKELLTTKNTKSPCMFLPLKRGVTDQVARKICREMQQVNLLEIVSKVEARTKFMIHENGKILDAKSRCKVFSIVVEFEDLKIVEHAFGVTPAKLESILNKAFVPRLMKAFKKILTAEKKGEKKDCIVRNGEVSKKNSFNLNPETAKPEESDAEKDFYADDEPRNDESGDEELAREFENQCLFKDEKFYVTMKSPLSSNYGMIIKLVENVLKLVSVHSVANIQKCHFYVEGNQKIIQTEGLNVKEVWKRANFFEISKINITDVHEFARKYGVH